MTIGPVTPPVGDIQVNTGHPGRGALPGDRFEGAGPAAAPATIPSAAILPAATALDAAVAEALGRQDGLAALFALGGTLAKTRDLPAPLAQALSALAGLVIGGDVGPGAVRAALLRSGLFHEHLMAGAIGSGAALPAPLPIDLKGVLAMLAGALKAWLTSGKPIDGDAAVDGGGTATAATTADPARSRLDPPPRSGPPVPQPAVPVDPALAADPRALAARLLAEIQHGAARIVLHQAASLDERSATDLGAPDPASTPGRHAWSFDLPLAGPAGVSMAALRVESDGGHDPRDPEFGPGGRNLRVEIGFAVEPLGPVQARIGLIGAGRLVIGLWCETPSAIARIEAEAPALRAAMAAAGLEVMMDVRIGRPPPREAPPPPPHRLDVSL